MDQRHPQPAPNYTNAALTMGWVNLISVIMVMWGLWGLLPVLMISAGLNRGITWLALRRS